jgi:hypothetical protein
MCNTLKSRLSIPLVDAMAVFKICSAAAAAAAPELDLSSDTDAASWIPASSAEMQKQPVFTFRCSVEI